MSWLLRETVVAARAVWDRAPPDGRARYLGSAAVRRRECDRRRVRRLDLFRRQIASAKSARIAGRRPAPDDHIHLLCEASDKIALGRGMQAFAISAARHLNRAHRHTGTVFPDHYHVEAIDSVRQACHELSYVLNNWRKHKQDGRGLFEGRIDPFSSGVLFEGWKERTHPVTIPEGYEAPRVSAAQTWYLTQGYRLGPPISVWAVPSEKRIRAAA